MNSHIELTTDAIGGLMSACLAKLLFRTPAVKKEYIRDNRIRDNRVNCLASTKRKHHSFCTTIQL